MRQERALLDPDDRDMRQSLAAAPGYGSDPDLVTPSTPWPLVLSDRQRRTIEALSDVILPASSAGPEPSAAGIAAFFDNWLSAPYDRQRADRTLIEGGLVWLDRYSTQRFGTDFLDLTDEQRGEIVEEMSKLWPIRPFFERFRHLVIGGYFTTDAGFAVLGYAGNVPLQDYPELPDDVADLIEEELDRLGL